MGKNGNYAQCSLCKYFVEDDETLKNAIEYCILLGINMDISGNCPDFISLDNDSLSLERNIDPEPVA